jgi:hypothetical protein
LLIVSKAQHLVWNARIIWEKLIHIFAQFQTKLEVREKTNKQTNKPRCIRKESHQKGNFPVLSCTN